MMLVTAQIALYAKTVSQSITINQNLYPDKTFEEIRSIAVKKAKIKAANDIYGEYIYTSTNIENGSMSSENINNVTSGVIHIKGSPKFKNGKKFGEIIVEIEAFASDEEIEQQKKLLRENQLKSTSDKQQFAQRKVPKQKGFYGKWSGYVMSSNFGTTKVALTVSPTAQSKLVYKNLHCGGDLLTKKKDTSYVEFKLILNYGRSNCQDKTKIILEKVKTNKVRFEEMNMQGDKLASGTLFRE
jgi:hypothetical protein